MQYDPDQYEGQLKDHGLRALVSGLDEQNPGLVVLTSRDPVREPAGRGSWLVEGRLIAELFG